MRNSEFDVIMVAGACPMHRSQQRRSSQKSDRRESPLRSCWLQSWCRMRRTTFIPICIAVFGWVSPGYAVPVVPSDPPMSAERIARLPSEIRRIVVARCGGDAEAGHYFATYDDDSNIVRLDYSLLQCPNASELCESASCVQTFVRHGGRYVLFQSSGNRSPRLHSRRDLTSHFSSRIRAAGRRTLAAVARRS